MQILLRGGGNLIYVSSDTILGKKYYEEHINLKEDIENELCSVITNLKYNYKYLLDNQNRFFQLKSKQADLNSLEQITVNMYDNAIKEYEKYLQIYKELILLKMKINIKIQDFNKDIKQIKIYIDCDEIQGYNILEIDHLDDKNLSLKETIENVTNKVLFLDQDEKELYFINNKSYDEEKIKDIKKIFDIDEFKQKINLNI